jgi:hypothetical protein
MRGPKKTELQQSSRSHKTSARRHTLSIRELTCEILVGLAPLTRMSSTNARLHRYFVCFTTPAVPQLIPELSILTMLRHAILATAPDVVVSFIDRTNVRVLAAMAETNVPVIVTEQTDARRISLGKWQGAREELYRRAAAAVVAPDPAIAAWLAAKGARARAIANPWSLLRR